MNEHTTQTTGSASKESRRTMSNNPIDDAFAAGAEAMREEILAYLVSVLSYPQGVYISTLRSGIRALPPPSRPSP